MAGKPGCFHVFVYATMAAKRAWFSQTFPDRAMHADQELAGHDKRRAAAIKQYYGQEWCARGMYHMLLNSCVGFEAMIAAVQGAIQARSSVAQACAS